MLSGTRVSRELDLGRLIEALRSPGIDSRNWISLARVKAVTVSNEGHFAQVIVLPGLQEFAAIVPTEYAGDGFGEYFPLDASDLGPVDGDISAGETVIVHAPDGDPGNGLIVAARLWSADAKPPQEAIDHPEDPVFHVKPGKTYRVTVSDGGEIHLGDADPASAIALAQKVITQFDDLVVRLEQAVADGAASFQDGGTSFGNALVTNLANWPGDVASTKVKAT